jgi:hypothetical protein
MKEEYSFGQRSFYADSVDYSTEQLLEMLKDQKDYGHENILVINDILEERRSNPSPDEEPEVFMNQGLESYETFEAETEKYWICPSCKKLVGVEFAVCWSCQGESPVDIEHPTKEDIIKDQASESIFNPVGKGFLMVIGGTVIGLFGMEKDYFNYLHWGRFIIGAIVVIVGIALIITGSSTNLNQDKSNKIKVKR